MRKGPSRPWSKSCIPGHLAQPGRLTTNHFPNGKTSCNVSGNGIIEGFAPGWVLPWLAGKAKSKRQRCSGVHGVKHTPKESRDSIFLDAFSMLGNCNLQSLFETRHDKFLSKPHIFVSSKWKMGLVRRTLWDAAFVCKSWLDLAGTSQSELTIASLTTKSTFQTISWRVRLWVMMLMDKVPQACEPQRPHNAQQRCKTLHACKTLVASLTSSNSGECFDCEFLEFSHTVCHSWSCSWGAKSTAEKHLKAGKASSMPNKQKPEKACDKNRTERRNEIWYQTASTTQIAATRACEIYSTKHLQTTKQKHMFIGHPLISQRAPFGTHLCHWHFPGAVA